MSHIVLSLIHVVSTYFRMANVIVDQHGRTIDASTGEEIQLTHHMPTLKVTQAHTEEHLQYCVSSILLWCWINKIHSTDVCDRMDNFWVLHFHL